MIKVLCTLLLSFFVLRSSELFSQIGRSIVPFTGHVIDIALDGGSGIAYILENKRVRYATGGTFATTSAPFDPKRLTNQEFSRAIPQAIAPYPMGGAAILWSGVSRNGDKISFITIWDKRKTLKLSIPIGGARRLAFSNDGGIYVLGLRKEEPQSLLHCFTPAGTFVQSLLQPESLVSPSDLGLARLVAVGSSIFAAIPTHSNKVYEYVDRKLAEVYDFPLDSRVMSLGPAEQNRACFVQLVKGTKQFFDLSGTSSGGAPVTVTGERMLNPLYEIYSITADKVELLNQSRDYRGFLLGFTDSGTAVYRELGAATKGITFIRPAR